MPDQKQKITPKEALDLYSKSGFFLWTDVRKSKVEFRAYKDGVQNIGEYKEAMKIDPVNETIKALLPILNIASQHLIKQWIVKACDIVGVDKFPDGVPGVFYSEEKRQKRNLWFNDIIEQVNIQHAYHRNESHKIARLRKDFEKKRRSIITKMVTAKLEAAPEKHYIRLATQ